MSVLLVDLIIFIDSSSSYLCICLKFIITSHKHDFYAKKPKMQLLARLYEFHVFANFKYLKFLFLEMLKNISLQDKVYSFEQFLLVH